MKNLKLLKLLCTTMELNTVLEHIWISRLTMNQTYLGTCVCVLFQTAWED